MEGSEYQARGVPPEHLGRLLLRAWRGVTGDGVALVRELGYDDLRPGYLPLFANIDAGGTRINELAERADVTRQMMGRLVRELQELGYVGTRVDPEDRRGVIVTLTKKGWKFRNDADRAMERMIGRYEEALGHDSIVALHDILKRLIAIAGNVPAAPEE